MVFGSILLIVNPAGLEFGNYAGTVRVQSGDAAIAPLVFNVTMTIGRSLPVVGAIANAASFDVGGIAPGEIVTVFGSNFGPAAIAGLRFDASGFVAAATGDTQVFFDGVAAPMIYSVAGQASAIVPYGVAGKASVRVQVDYLGTRSAGLDVRVVASAPGLFNAVLNQDGSVNGPGNPAEAGSIVVLFATGEGVTSPPSVDGAITGSSLPKPVLPVSVTIGGRAAEILYAGAAPGLVAGVMQVNARVPADAPSGAQGVVLAVGEGRSRGSVAVAVK